jgi:hypothetical protein
MKTCTSCNLTKELDSFGKEKNGKFGRRSVCRKCRSENEREYKKQYKADNRIAVSEYNKKYHEENKEERISYMQDYRDNNKDYFKNWRKLNKDLCRAQLAKYRSKKAKATPDWVDKEDLKGMYTLAKRLENLCGVSYHVDHIVPLNGENICGLHVPWNLQILEAKMNLSKGNSYASW